MTDKLREYLDGLFAAVPNTQEVKEAKDELYDGMVERYEDCLKEGMDEQAAYDCVVDSIGDIRELIDELDTDEGATGEQKTEEEPKSNFDLNDFVKGVTHFAANLVSGVSDEISSWFSEPPLGEVRLVNTITLPLEDINNIEISYVSDAVRLRYADGDALVVREYMNRDDEGLLAEVSSANGSIDIRHGRRGGLFFLRSRVEVLLPASWDGSLSLSSVSGRIQSDDAWRLASLSLKTVSGEIEFDTAEAGMIRASTTSGAIRMRRAEGALDLHSISGSVRVESIAGNGSFSTTSGSLRLVFDELRGNVKATSISGGIRLGIPTDASVELEAKSTSGSIHTAFNDSLSYHRRNRVHGFVGEAPYHHVHATSTSGGIHVND